MDIPAVARDALNGEEFIARIPIGGDDTVFITPTRTLIYRSEGLLSDESVKEYVHDVEGLEISEGRRKATVTLTSTINGTQEFTIPASHVEELVHPLLAGILIAGDIVSDRDAVWEIYRFGDRTLVITNDRLLEHEGAPIWDGDFASISYETVTNLETEVGETTTQMCVETTDTTHRVTLPRDQAMAVRDRLDSAIRTYHGIESGVDLQSALQRGPTPAQESETVSQQEAGDGGFIASVAADAIDTIDDPTSATTEQDGSDDDSAVAEELAELRDAIETQNELLEQQQATIEQLIEELRRGR